MINLYIVDYFDLFKNNGIATYINQLEKSLKKNPTIKCNYILVKSNKLYKEVTSVIEKEIQIIYMPNEIGTNVANSQQQIEAAEQICKNIVQHQNLVFHFNWINHSSFSWFLKRKVSCRTVLTKHCIPWRDFVITNYQLFREITQDYYFSKQNKWFLHPALIREKIAYDCADHIICVTNFSKNALKKVFRVPPEKTTVIYNGIEIKANKKLVTRSDLRKKYGFNDYQKIIIFAGSISLRKGIQDLVSVFEQVSKKYVGAKLIIAGEGDYERLFKKIKGTWSNIVFTGNLPTKTLYEFYQLADVGVVPSYWEQCSYTAIEMMKHKLPIVVSNIEGLAEIVPDNCGLKVRINMSKNGALISHKQLLSNILYLLSNKKHAQEISYAAKNYADKQFCIKEMALKTVSVYAKQELLNVIDNSHENPLNKDNEPLVSILLPCYNNGQYLEQCINSILKQTYSNFEVLILDDGSIDQTTSVASKFSDSRICFYKEDINKGIVSGLNKLLNLAKGKYIARLDGDDFMHKERLKKQVDFLERELSYSMVGCNHYIVDENDAPQGIFQYPQEDEDIRVLIFFRNPFLHPSILVRSSTIKKYKYSERYKFCEDYHLWFKISKSHKLYNLPDFLTYYRVHKKSSSSLNARLQQENTLELISDQLRKISIPHSSEELAIHAAIYFRLGKRYFNSDEKISLAKSWIMKVLDSLKKTGNFPLLNISEISNHILKESCSF